MVVYVIISESAQFSNINQSCCKREEHRERERERQTVRESTKDGGRERVSKCLYVCKHVCIDMFLWLCMLLSPKVLNSQISNKVAVKRKNAERGREKARR